MTEKRCYTVKELQEILGVSRPSVYELLKKNEFRSYVIGGKHIISKRSFDKWFDGEEAEAGDEESGIKMVAEPATNSHR